MEIVDSAALAALLLSAPAWARHCLSVNDPALRQRAATEIAELIALALRPMGNAAAPPPVEAILCQVEAAAAT